jgi:hypothetical protein
LHCGDTPSHAICPFVGNHELALLIATLDSSSASVKTALKGRDIAVETCTIASGNTLQIAIQSTLSVGDSREYSTASSAGNMTLFTKHHLRVTSLATIVR